MGITHYCIGLSYLTAFGLETYQMVRHAWWSRVAGIVFVVAGLLAHTIFLAYHQPTPAAPDGSLLLLAWVFAVFYLYGILHSEIYPWAWFVLPLVLILVGLSFFFTDSGNINGSWFSGEHFWGMFHGTLVLLASVGITLAFLASLMYLVQSERLKKKLNPIGGVQLLSLERLERINRRAINLAFPLLTAGLLVGALQAWRNPRDWGNWTDPKMISTIGLWLVGLLMLYLRYGAHVRGRRLAWITILAFVVMLVALGTSHPFVRGGSR